MHTRGGRGFPTKIKSRWRPLRLILTFLALGTLAFVTSNLYNTSIQIELRSYAAPSAATGEGATTTASAWEGPLAPKGDPEGVVAAVDAVVGGAGSEEASEEAIPAPPTTPAQAGPSSRRASRPSSPPRRVSKRKARLQQHQHHAKIASDWAKLLLRTSFEIPPRDVCAYAQEAPPPESGGGEIPPELMSQVRSCLRAVIAHARPWDRESLRQARIQDEVSALTKIDLAAVPAFYRLVKAELSHVEDEEMLVSARKVFLSAADRLGGEGEGKGEGLISDGDDKGQEKGKGMGKGSAVASGAGESISASPAHSANASEALESVRAHALQSWVHRDNTAARAKSKAFMRVLERSKVQRFRPCRGEGGEAVPMPLVTHKALFSTFAQDKGEASPPTIRFPPAEGSNSAGSAKQQQQEKVIRYSDGILDLLPEDEASCCQWRFASCAVVGNGGGLKHGYGAAVDRNEAVFRINHAPVQGYEPLVGSKTTFDVVTTEHARDLARARAMPDRGRLKGSTLLLAEAHTAEVTEGLAQDLLQQFSPGSYYHTPTVILSPTFSAYVEKLWNAMFEALEALEALPPPSERRRPPPEFVAVATALQACDHLHLFGFHQYKAYFSWKQGAPVVKPFVDPAVTAAARFMIKHMAILEAGDAYRQITNHVHL